MIKYQYQIIRYIHDRVTGEFVNVGLILYEPISKYIQCRVITNDNRISHFFRDVNGAFLLATLRQFKNKVSEISKSIDEFISNHDVKDLASISDFILYKDDSALIITEVKYGIDLQVNTAFEDLYHRIVEQYTNGTNAVKKLRLDKLQHGLPFMIYSKELPVSHCYLEYPNGCIVLVTLSKSRRDFDIVRELTLEESKELRKKFDLEQFKPELSKHF